MTILRTLIFLCLTLCSATMAHAEPRASDKNLIVDPPVPSSGDRVGVTAYYHNDGPLVPKSVRYEEGAILIDYAILDGYIFMLPMPLLIPGYSTAWLQSLPPGEYEIRATLRGYAYDTATWERIDYSYPPRRITVSPAEEDAVIDAVEYYHAGLDHYFLSAAQAEIALIDADRFPGWARTGRSFRVFAAARPERAPVCRYYIPPGKGDSHFFGVATIDSPTPFRGDECRDIELATFAGSGALHGLVKETANAFYVLPPDRTTGACPAGSRPVYRLWNQRSDSNHRYTTDLAVRAEMLARGYVSEGYGLLGVVMCVPE